jgi:hypothetical protein
LWQEFARSGVQFNSVLFLRKEHFGKKPWSSFWKICFAKELLNTGDLKEMSPKQNFETLSVCVCEFGVLWCSAMPSPKH